MGLCKNSLTTNNRCMHSSECSNNQPITQVIHKNKKGEVVSVFDANDSQESNAMPPVLMVESKTRKQGVVIKGNAAGESNKMPPIVLGEIGRTSSSMIRTGDTDPLEKMRKCQTEQEEETPMIMPGVVVK